MRTGGQVRGGAQNAKGILVASIVLPHPVLVTQELEGHREDQLES